MSPHRFHLHGRQKPPLDFRAEVNQVVKYKSRPMSPDRLNRVFAALADPTRREILGQLSKGVRSVTELAEPHAMSLPAISKHLRVLEQSGLIQRGREAQWRPCRIQAAPLKEAVDWIGQYRRHWEESLDRLDDYLQQLQTQPSHGRSKKKPASKVR